MGVVLPWVGVVRAFANEAAPSDETSWWVGRWVFFVVAGVVGLVVLAKAMDRRIR